MNRLAAVVLIVLGVSLLSACAGMRGNLTALEGAQDAPLPRVGVKPGHRELGSFVYAKSGKPFVPKGFNHTVLGPPNQHHVVFNVGQYDSAAMESTLSEMARVGANTIRLWAWGDVSDGSGVVGAKDSGGVCPAYMDNFVDFLRRCRRHHIYVVAVLDECPLNSKYAGIVDRAKLTEPCPAVAEYNMQYLSTPFIEAKAALVRDFVGAVKDRDEGLLSSVLAWSMCNEAFVFDTYGPFDRKDGVVTVANGKGYDMGDRSQRQACWDDGIVHWANVLTKAVKDVDPEALVTAGLFTSDAQGRMPVNGLMEQRPDCRYPPRPSVLARPSCGLDFLDIHVYPFSGEMRLNLEANEYGVLRTLGKPVLAGEYGVFRAMTKPEDAVAQERTLRGDIGAHGYWGPLLWIWDLIPGSNTYVAKELGMR